MAQHITASNLPQPPPDQGNAAGSPASGEAASGDTASLAARNDLARHLTIQVRVNGHGPYNFVVDTGAERSVISQDVANALNLPLGEKVTIQGIAKAVVVETVRAQTVSFGPFVRNDILLPILSQATLAADGYLGLDVINGTRVTFDFRHRQLRIEQPKNLFVPADPTVEARVSAKGKAGRLQIIDCLVDSCAAIAFIDTGAEVSVGNMALLEALKSRRRRDPAIATANLTGVTGGELEALVAPVNRIRLQDLTFTNGMLAFADVPDFDAWNLKFRPAVLIGMDYLRQFASVSVDYRAKEIRFMLSLAPPNPRPGVEIGGYS